MVLKNRGSNYERLTFGLDGNPILEEKPRKEVKFDFEKQRIGYVETNNYLGVNQHDEPVFYQEQDFVFNDQAFEWHYGNLVAYCTFHLVIYFGRRIKRKNII